MIIADELASNEKCWPRAGLSDGRWVLAKPLPGPLSWRLRDAWEVFRGRAEAVSFIE